MPAGSAFVGNRYFFSLFLFLLVIFCQQILSPQNHSPLRLYCHTIILSCRTADCFVKWWASCSTTITRTTIVVLYADEMCFLYEFFLSRYLLSAKFVSTLSILLLLYGYTIRVVL